jgi:hypothetical protein
VSWLKKFFAHANGIAIARAYTCSDCFHDFVVPHAQTLLFPRGKTKFIRPDGTIGTAPGHGIVLVSMGAVANTRECGRAPAVSVLGQGALYRGYS